MLRNGKVLIAGGSSEAPNIVTAELYDPATGTFTPTGSMGTPVRAESSEISSESAQKRGGVDGGLHVPGGRVDAPVEVELERD